MRNLAAIILLSFLSAPLLGQVNYSEDIAPIIYDHCTKCHREGEIAPFSLESYDDAMSWGSMIEYVTSIKTMPPWSPDPEYVHFRDENVLSDEEIALITEWVDGGMVQGDPDLEPDLPVFPEGSQIGTPDLVLTMDEAYLHEGDGTDQYQVFIMETGLLEDVDVESIEVRADNANICHHAILAVDTSDQAYEFADEDPDLGYEGFGGFGFEPTIEFWTAWVPGANPIVYPSTIGTKLFADSKILMQMHYGPSSADEYDQTTINIFYAEDPIQRYITTFPISPNNLEELFLIPPGEVTTFHGTQYVADDYSLLGIAPHCHLLGQSWEIYATGPDNDTIPLISIPQWQFNWQGFYSYENMVHIPAGYTIHCIGTYDNTVDNPYNPNDPPQWSYWGEGTSDEMYLCYLTIIPYMEGDEDISLAAADENNMMKYPDHELFPSYPNPTRDQFTIGFSLESNENVNCDLVDQNGRVIRSLASNKHYPMGYHKLTFDVNDLAVGTYYYRLYFDGFDQSHVIYVVD